MIIADLAHLARPITDLKPLPGNPRRGDVDAVMRSYHQFGQRKPIVARPDGTVIAGNHQLEAAKRLGWTEIAVVTVDDDDLTAKAYALADNRTADLGTYDDDALRELLADVATDPDLLLSTGYSEADVDALMADLTTDLGIASPEPAIPDTAPAKTIRGDIWLLGNHRLMCGNSSIPTDIDTLMAGTKADMVFTDPPYGMNLDTDYSPMQHGGKKHRPVAGDNQQFDASIILSTFSYCKEIFLWGADYYIETLNRQYPDLGSWIVWDKYSDDRIGLLDGRFGSTFEICWSKTPHKRDIARVLVKTNYTSKGDETRVHPTQKPVALAEWFLNKWSKPAHTIVDLYAGSGSTLIAAHNLNRTAYLMELDEHYCDIICKRFQQATGITPIAASTGQPHSFID